jgi:short-subunit dehydrogenase
MELKDAVCLVTGASSGIGRETAVELAKRGAVLAICARRKDKLEQTLAECRKHSPRSISVPCDVADPAAVKAMVQEVERTVGPVDVLVANAGWGRYVAFTEETVETIEGQVKTNVLGQMYCVHEVLPGMQQRRRGHIVLLSSTNGRLYPPLQSVYNATKAAALGFGEGLIPEVKAFGIGVTIVYPGPIATEFFDAPEFQRMRKPKDLPAENMAREIVKGIERNKVDVTYPRILRMPAKMKALFPGLIRRGVANYAKKALPKP